MKLGDVVKVEKAPAPAGDSIWLLNLDAVEKNSGKVLEKKRIEPDSVSVSTTAFSENAILYSKLRPNLNKVVVADEPGLATSEMLPLVPNSEVLERRYLAYLLRSRAFVHLAVSSTAGSKMPRVSKRTLLEAVFEIPDLETQRRRIELLSSIETARSNVELQLESLDSLVKSRFASHSDHHRACGGVPRGSRPSACSGHPDRPGSPRWAGIPRVRRRSPCTC